MKMRPVEGIWFGLHLDGACIGLCILVTLGVFLSAGCEIEKPTTALEEKASRQPLERGEAVHGSQSPEQRIRNTITLYIGYLIEGYKTLDMTPLQAVASKERAESAYYHMAALSEGKTRMVSELKAIEFGDITLAEDGRKATLTTEEVWDFAYENMETGETTGEVTEYLYRVTYTLEELDGRWMITDTVAEGEKAGGEPAPGGQRQP